MPESYPYPIVPKDPLYFRALIDRDVASADNPCLGITTYADRIIIFFGKPLTADRKAKLDEIASTNPVPTERIEFGAIDIAEGIYTAIGKRPVRVDYDESRDHAVIDFDVALTDAERVKVEAILKARRLKKRRGGNKKARRKR